MQVKFRTLTPIFTGNAESNQERLRESGLIGSLRFWAGATARGLGYELVGDNENPPDVNTIEDTEKLDPVTGIFGCTGWKRIFQMKIFEPLADNVNILIPSEEVHVQARNHGWTLKPGCLFPWNKPVLINHIFRRPLSQKWERSSGLGLRADSFNK
jgi:CRISPR-associated protein Cmr1